MRIATAEATSLGILRPRMPELDTLRGIAALLVLFFHGIAHYPATHRLAGVAKWTALAASPGWVGVNLFFVLSGFLITGILLDSRARPRYYSRFYSRRILRILPAYYAILVLVLIAARTGLAERSFSWGYFGLCAIYLANVTELLGVASQYTVLWSLAVEEHFYLLWPMAVRLLSKRWLGVVAVSIIIGCPLLRAYYFRHGLAFGSGYTWLVADGLACGALLAVLARTLITTRRAMLIFGVVTCTLAAALVVMLLPAGIPYARTLVGGSLRVSFLNIFFTGVLALSLFLGTSARRNWILLPSLRFFADISYGLYLVHMIVFDVVDHFMKGPVLRVAGSAGDFIAVWFRFFVGAGLSVAVAYLSRWYFEERFLRMKDSGGVIR